MMPSFVRSAWKLLPGLAALAALALFGGWAADRVGLGLPGPVIGLAAYIVLLALVPGFARLTQTASEGLLRLLGLLITPAAVGLTLHTDELAGEVGRLALAIVVSTVVTGIVTVLAYRGLRKWLG